MLTRKYLSNLCRWWSIERQRRALADVDGVEHIDLLVRPDRHGKRPAGLAERERLTRPSSRELPDELTVVANPCVMAWSADQMLVVAAGILARGGVLRSMEPPAEVRGSATAIDLAPLVAAFEAGRTTHPENRGKAGAAASTEKRVSEANARADTVREDWINGNPREHTDKALAARAGVWVGKLKARHGPRQNRRTKP